MFDQAEVRKRPERVGTVGGLLDDTGEWNSNHGAAEALVMSRAVQGENAREANVLPPPVGTFSEKKPGGRLAAARQRSRT